jgi:glutaredoxin-related protein
MFTFVFQVPQIFICGRLIGGCDDLRRMHSDGSLQTALQQCCKGDVTCRN